jgi:hypothetical protein
LAPLQHLPLDAFLRQLWHKWWVHAADVVFTGIMGTIFYAGIKPRNFLPFDDIVDLLPLHKRYDVLLLEILRLEEFLVAVPNIRNIATPVGLILQKSVDKA